MLLPASRIEKQKQPAGPIRKTRFGFMCALSASRGHAVERAANPLHRAGINAKTHGNPTYTFTSPLTFVQGGLDTFLKGAIVAVAAAVAWRQAEEQRHRAEQALATTTQLANTLVLNLGPDPHALGLPPDLLRKILNGAIKGYDKVIVLDPRNPLGYNDRGNAYFARGELDQAIADFDHAIVDYDEAIKLNPKYALAYNNRCWTRVVIGRKLQQALLDCSESLRI
jgi:tetratricopeptide (TPR) repeat protein